MKASFLKIIYRNRFLVLKVLVATIVAACFFIVTYKNFDPDLGWHLKVGQQIVQSGRVPHQDTFSHTMPGFNWVDHEWAIEAILWLAYAKNLWLLVMIFFALAASFPFFFWVARAKNKASLWTLIPAAILMVRIIGIRPQIVSFLFFFIVFELLYFFYIKSRELWDYKKMLLLPLIFFVWANLHAGFIGGLALVAIFVFSDALIVFWKKNKSSRNRLLFEFIILFVCFGLTFLNPYGAGPYRELLTISSSKEVFSSIAEWRSPFLLSTPELSVLLGIFLFLAAINFKKYPLYLLLSALFFLALFIKSARNAPLFLVTALPVIFLGWEATEKKIKDSRIRAPLNKKALIQIGAATIILFVVGFLFLGFFVSSYESSDYPEKAALFLSAEAKEKSDIVLFNSYGWGGYLIWKVPEVKIFVDGRMPHWVDSSGGSAMKDYLRVFDDLKNAGWQEVFSRRGINEVIIPNNKNYCAKQPLLYQYLVNTRFGIIFTNLLISEKSDSLQSELLKSGWQDIYHDDVAVILERPTPNH